MKPRKSPTEPFARLPKGFCIYIDTICDGPIPVEHDENGNLIVYETRELAEREIAEDTMHRIQQFLDGERDFDDAMTLEEYVVEVRVCPDGSVIDAAGRRHANVG